MREGDTRHASIPLSLCYTGLVYETLPAVRFARILSYNYGNYSYDALVASWLWCEQDIGISMTKRYQEERVSCGHGTIQAPLFKHRIRQAFL
jgi:hypothetical protein